jgi:hypothetical protein
MELQLLNNKLNEFVLNELDKIAKSNPLIGFSKPLITRAINNNFNKVKGILNLLSDSQGNIDIENILPEMIKSLMNVDTFTYNTDFMGDIIIGNGKIQFTIPVIQKTLILNTGDIEDLRQFLIKN